MPLASAHACSTSASARRVASAAVVGRLYLRRLLPHAGGSDATPRSNLHCWQQRSTVSPALGRWAVLPEPPHGSTGPNSARLDRREQSCCRDHL